MEKRYFFGHQSSSANADELRKVIGDIFGPYGYKPCYADKATDEQSLLLEICQSLFSTSFSIFDLSSGDHNVYLEIGIALGLNRPIVVTCKDDVSLPSVLQGCNVVLYSDYVDLESKLRVLCSRDFLIAPRTVSNHCYFCNKVCNSMSTPPDDKAYLVLNHSRMLWRSLMPSLEPSLAKYSLHPIYLADQALGPSLCDIRRKVLSCQFVICNLGSSPNKRSLLALGIAIANCTPWLLLSRKNAPGSVPSDLQESACLEYESLADLERRLNGAVNGFLEGIVPGVSQRGNGTAAMSSLPFWVRFGNWRDSVIRTLQPAEEIRGRLRVIQYEGQKCLSNHVPGTGLLFGSGSECDVVLNNINISSHHFRILRGRNQKYFIEDLHSKNGTWLNGKRLLPGETREIGFGDTVRVPSVARFVIWDNRPLPKENTAQTVHTGNTGFLPPRLKIELLDVSPPTYLNEWDCLRALEILHPDGYTRSMIEVQAYYPMGKILSRLVVLLGLPKEKTYRFKIGSKFLDENETPLSSGINGRTVLQLAPAESWVA